MITLLEEKRINTVKKAFVTRGVPCSDIRILSNQQHPKAGDVLLAQVVAIGKQKTIELTTGRKSTLHVGDEIIVAYGNRYAPDQYEAEIPEDLSECDLVAVGGIASRALTWSTKVGPPTRIRPIGILAGKDNKPLNLANYAIPNSQRSSVCPPVIAVVGSSMNSGKTTTAVNLVRGLVRLGHKVGFAKITGTGSGGDLWKMRDAGASVALDFTDAGLATTFKAPIDQLEKSALSLTNYLAKEGCTTIIIEIADGIYQQETSALITNSGLRNMIDGYVYAADGATGAAAGVQWLRQHGLILGVSGVITASPLASREAEAITGVTCYSSTALSEGDVIQGWLNSDILVKICKAQ